MATIFPINPTWLATGNSGIRLDEPVSPILLQCPAEPNGLFSSAYDQYLGKVFSSEEIALTRNFDSLRRCVVSISERLEAKGKLFPPEFRDVVAADLRQLANQIMAISKSDFEQSARLGPKRFQLTAKVPVPNNLPIGQFKIDIAKPSAILDSMRSEVPTWPELKKDIKRYTAQRGAKKTLADKFGVSRQVLGNWLSDDGKASPTAELTLRLLDWVAKQKHPKK